MEMPLSQSQTCADVTIQYKDLMLYTVPIQMNEMTYHPYSLRRRRHRSLTIRTCSYLLPIWWWYLDENHILPFIKGQLGQR